MQCSTTPIATRSARACHQRALLPARNLRITAPRCSASQKDTKAEIVTGDVTSAVLRSSALLSPFLFHVQSALATGGEYGLLEGRTAALVHPAIMFTLLASTGYAGYLGWQWRRAREIGEEIRELKKSQPAPAADGAVTVSFDGGSAVVDQIVAKEKERKELIAGNFKDKHFWWGSLILASGTGIAIEGCVNTYMRTGKLFPGPHLFAGAGMVAIWALAAALVPEMQKGNNNARSAHIALNAVNFLLFASQVPTGLEIVGKVFQFTQWP